MSSKKSHQLTEKQEAFCRLYIDVDGNAAEAYRMAYDSTNMQAATVYREASRLLDNHKITTRIFEIRRQRYEATESERRRVEQCLMDIIEANVLDFYYTDPKTGQMKIRTPLQLPLRLRHAVRAIRGSGDNITYDLHNKIDAIRALSKMNGWDRPEAIAIARQPDNFKRVIRIGFDNGEIAL